MAGRGPGSNGLTGTESLYYFSIGAMFVLQDLSLTLFLCLPHQKISPDKQPFCECPLSHITPAVCPLTHTGPKETNSFSFTEGKQYTLTVSLHLHQIHSFHTKAPP